MHRTLLVSVILALAQAKVHTLTQKPSAELVPCTNAVDLLLGQTEVVKFSLKIPLNDTLTVNFKKSDELIICPTTIVFTDTERVAFVNVTGADVVGRTFVEVQDCGKSKCPFDPEAVYVQVSVYRSRIAHFLVQLTGWGYFMAWSVSFYPQMWLNYKRKSVQGLHFDFLFLNLIGFTAYAIYNLALYYSDTVQDQYLDSQPKAQIPVMFNDVVFAVHAFFACVITVFQCCLYDRGSQSLSMTGLTLGSSLISTILIALFILWIRDISALTLVTILSYVKMIVTCSKYVPQAVFNFRRRSTVGWSIENMLLDFMGGSLSILQMVINSWNSDDWSAFTGNVVKFGLGLISMFFDILFFVQHYCLYREREEITIFNDDPEHTVDDVPIVDRDQLDHQHQEYQSSQTL